MEANIVSYCKIKNNSVWLNGEKIIEDNKSPDFNTFLVNLYKQMNLNYPKFFKMDNLCKLGLLAAEMIITNDSEFRNYDKENTAIFLSNNSSSIETDRTHLKTISDKQHYFPSPSVFVYTLPNIVIGEIAIKHKITGENAFFVSETFDEKLFHTYATSALQNNHTSAAICGWVNVDENENEAFLYYVEKANLNINKTLYTEQHNIDTISKLYKKDI